MTENRSLRPIDDDDTPNANPAGVPPASVAKPDYDPGDPNGFELVDEGPGRPRGTIFHASPWDGWPAEWNMPLLGGGSTGDLFDTAWAALDLNSSVFASMPVYMVGASPNLPDGWIDNPDPDKYNSWVGFARALMWDYQLGEVFVVCTARFANGWHGTVPRRAAVDDRRRPARRRHPGLLDRLCRRDRRRAAHPVPDHRRRGAGQRAARRRPFQAARRLGAAALPDQLRPGRRRADRGAGVRGGAQRQAGVRSARPVGRGAHGPSRPARRARRWGDVEGDADQRPAVGADRARRLHR